MRIMQHVRHFLRRSCGLLTVFSPTLNSAVRYFIHNKHLPNLKNPQTFSEKLVYLKLRQYCKDPRVIRCADKLAVRGYVQERGYGELLNRLIGVYESTEQIPWAQLPEQFVLKWNFGATFNIICDDKSGLDIESVQKQLRAWGKSKYWLQDGELQYKYCPKRLICEEYLDTDQGFLPYDYKLYCFHGEVKAVLLITDREKDKKAGFFTPDWRYIGPADGKYLPFEELPPMPASFVKMMDCAQALSKDFPFVRVDFYQYCDRAVFGEMTFTPGAGIFMSQTAVDGVSMGEMLRIEM